MKTLLSSLKVQQISIFLNLFDKNVYQMKTLVSSYMYRGMYSPYSEDFTFSAL